MLQEIKWEGTKNWQEWLWIWDKNEKGEFSKDGKPNSHIAKGLLFAGPEVHCDPIKKDGSYVKDFDKVKFYLKVAWWDDSSKSKRQRSIGEKAYQILVTKLLPDFRQIWYQIGWFIGSKVGIELIEEIIGFFAQSGRLFYYDKEPYRSAGKNFVKHLYLGIKAGGDVNGWSSFPLESKKILLRGEKEIAKALMNLDSYDFIIAEQIFGAIPVLREEVVHDLCKSKIVTMDIKDMLNREFPGGAKEFRKALEDLDPRAFTLAFKHSDKEARVLYELLAKKTKK